MRWAALVMLYGCVLPSGEDGRPVDVEVGDAVAPVVLDPMEVEIPEALRSTLQEGVHSWLEQVADLDVDDALDVAVQMREHAGARCPVMEETPFGQAWSATPCDTTSGNRFSGRWSEATRGFDELVPRWLADPWVIEAVETVVPAWRPTTAVDSAQVVAFDANARVQPLLGDDLVLSGQFREADLRWKDLSLRHVVVGGPWWDVLVEVRAIPELEVLELSTSEVRTRWARGWLTGLTGGVEVVFSEGIRSVPGCPTEAAGTLEAIDSEGRNYAIVLDGDVSCDGCAEVFRDGVRLSPICTDPTEGQLGL